MKILNALLRYGNTSPENLAKIQTWFTESMEQLAEGKGSQIVSGSGSGQSFAMSLDPNMTLASWVEILDRALTMLENGQTRIIKQVCVRF